jgi:hypothetical protein
MYILYDRSHSTSVTNALCDINSGTVLLRNNNAGVAIRSTNDITLCAGRTQLAVSWFFNFFNCTKEFYHDTPEGLLFIYFFILYITINKPLAHFKSCALFIFHMNIFYLSISHIICRK